MKVEGFNASRHVVTCNGRRVPLTSTGRSGEYVAGMRFKAWKLAAALQPTIDVHAPLTFDICRCLEPAFVGRLRLPCRPSRWPQLRNFPVNSYEAEARRLARFQDHGHTPGERDVPGKNARPNTR